MLTTLVGWLNNAVVVAFNSVCPACGTLDAAANNCNNWLVMMIPADFQKSIDVCQPKKLEIGFHVTPIGWQWRLRCQPPWFRLTREKIKRLEYLNVNQVYDRHMRPLTFVIVFFVDRLWVSGHLRCLVQSWEVHTNKSSSMAFNWWKWHLWSWLLWQAFNFVLQMSEFCLIKRWKEKFWAIKLSISSEEEEEEKRRGDVKEIKFLILEIFWKAYFYWHDKW